MADTSVPITAGSGTNIDARTEDINSDIRQVVVIGDPSAGTGVAPVDATNGLAVQIIPALPTGTNSIGIVVSVGNVASGATDSGNPVKIGGKYNSTAPVLTNGQRADVQLDSGGNLKTTPATLSAGEDLATNRLLIEQRASYSSPITADTAVKSASGVWYGFIVNSHTSGTLKVWDNTSAATTVLCDTITFPAGPFQWVFPVGIIFNTGLYFDIGGTVSITPLFR